MGMLRPLQGTSLSEEQGGHVGLAKRSCKRPTRPLSRILDLPRLAAGMDDYLAKPLEMDDLLRVVLRILGQRD